MSYINIANDNFESPVSGPNTASSPSIWQSRSSNQVSWIERSADIASKIAFSIEAGQHALQGNAAQFVVQRNRAMPSPDEFTDKKIELVEAHTDTKIERLGGKIDVLITKIDSLKDDVSRSDQYNHDTRLVIIGLAFTLAVLVVALAAYGDALFSRGMNVRDVVQTVIKEQQEIQKRDTTQHQPHN